MLILKCTPTTSKSFAAYPPMKQDKIGKIVENIAEVPVVRRTTAHKLGRVIMSAMNAEQARDEILADMLSS